MVSARERPHWLPLDGFRCRRRTVISRQQTCQHRPGYSSPMLSQLRTLMRADLAALTVTDGILNDGLDHIVGVL
jgi:hypothetical protein